MFDRQEEPRLRRSLEIFPAVGILGPRQVGKTTLAKQLGTYYPDCVYLDLENPEHLARLSDPVLYLRSFQGRLCILDEVQCLPELFPILRALIDEKRQPGRFLILGSASPQLLKQSSESLAGRIRYHKLSPLSVQEISPALTIDPLWLRGGFPPALLSETDSDAMDWLESFVRTFLERDLSVLNISLPSVQLRRFWTMLAHCQGQLFNASRLATALSVSSTTTRRWLDVLSDTYMVRQLQPWTMNTGKRVVKTPKSYISDSGIVHRLLGIDTLDQLLSHPVCGHSWEGFVIEQIASAMPYRTELFHYRTRGGAEIDLLLRIPGNDQLVAVEIKRSLSPKLQRGFWNAMEDAQCHQAYIVYPGDVSWPIAENVRTLPITEVRDIFAHDTA